MHVNCVTLKLYDESFIYLCSIISKPLADEKSSSAIYGRVLFAWLSSVLAAVSVQLCWEVLNHYYVITVTVFLTCSMFVPGMIIVTVYCITGIALTANTLKHENNRAMKVRKRQNSNVLKMFAAITISFFIFTTPWGIWNLYRLYMYSSDSWILQYETIYVPGEICCILFSTNLFANPIIYAKLHRETRKYLKKLIQKIKNACCNC